jgi:ATP phosphoribosyltransferase regulatory subunit
MKRILLFVLTNVMVVVVLGIVASLLEGVHLNADLQQQIHTALASKNASELSRLTLSFDPSIRNGLLALVDLYGDASVLDQAEKVLPAKPAIQESLLQLRWLAQHIAPVKVSFDLADARGYAYYSGLRFAIYAQNASDALVRGGRYDGVGAVFGHQIDRERPAVGFSMDLKQLVASIPALALRAAIRAPWGDAPDLRNAIARLRGQGETVVCVLPGHESEVDEFHCDRTLVEAAGQWVVQAL